MKENIENILGMTTSLVSDFGAQALHITQNKEINKVIMSNISRLREIRKGLTSSGSHPHYCKNTIDRVLYKFRNSLESEEVWSLFELRLLSYNLGLLQSNKNEFTKAIELITNNWHNSCIGGLLHFVLEKWHSSDTDLLEQTLNLLKSQLNLYMGEFPKYRVVKSRLDYLTQRGPIKLVAYMISNSQSLMDAPLLMGLRKDNLHYEFYSDVILNYVRYCDISIEEAEKILSVHQMDRTKKLVMGYYIEKADATNNSMEHGKASQCASRVLHNDIFQQATWAPFNGANAEEVKYLKYVHELLMSWQITKSIEIFFRELCQEPERRKFWLRYVHSIEDYKIAGTVNHYYQLRKDKRMHEILSKCFIDTSSQGSETAALILYIKNKVFIEFSDTGALYVYNARNPKVAGLKQKRNIDKIESLKQPSINLLIESDSASQTNYEEGKMHHRGRWMARLEGWMKIQMSTAPNYRRSFNRPIHQNDEINRELKNISGDTDKSLDKDLDFIFLT